MVHISYPTSQVVKDTNSFPYLIAQEDTNPTSYITISSVNEYGDDGEVLFFVAGGSVLTRDVGGQLPVMCVELRHTHAYDRGGDNAYLCEFEVKNLQLVSMRGKEIVYSGWLTTAKFYPGEEEGSKYSYPFADVPPVSVSDDSSGLTFVYPSDTSYPFKPPTVTMENEYRLPLEVVITVRYEAKNVINQLESYVIKTALEKVKEAEAAESARILEEEKRAKQKREYEEWLNSEEGKASELDRRIITKVKETIPEGSNFSEEELEAIRLQATEDANALNENDLVLIKTIVIPRLVTFKRHTGRHQYLKTFDETVLGR